MVRQSDLTSLASVREALSLADAAGIDNAQLLEVLSLGVCNSPLLGLKGAKMIAGDHATNFPLKHARKDMRLAVDLGKTVGLGLPIALSTDVAMKTAMEMDDLAEQDFSALYESIKTADKMALERRRFHLQLAKKFGIPQ